MDRHSTSKRLLAVLAGWACLVSPAFALRTTTMSVSASVVPSALFGVEFSSEPIVITPADVNRGYVDVVMKSRMQLRMPSTKARAVPSVTVDVAAREDLFKSVDVTTQPPHSGNGNGNGNGHGDGHGSEAVTGPPTETGVQTAQFRYRFGLSDRARPGSFGTSVSLAIDL